MEFIGGMSSILFLLIRLAGVYSNVTESTFS